MKFVKVDRGFVNLDHVVKISCHDDQSLKGRVIETFYGPDGSIGSRATFAPSDFESASGPCVPAAPDEHAVIVWGNLGTDDPDEVYVERPRIIAWVVGEYPRPIFIEGFIDNARRNSLMFFRDTGESLRLPAEANFENLQAALSHAKDHFASVRKNSENSAKSAQSDPKKSKDQ